ncbi:MAG: hypothetical protein Q8K60_08860 [Parachlamydiaceae bacterium]|nr:hypothetical protein [Parachlamydiaceae bacterium]
MISEIFQIHFIHPQAPNQQYQQIPSIYDIKLMEYLQPYYQSRKEFHANVNSKLEEITVKKNETLKNIDDLFNNYKNKS